MAKASREKGKRGEREWATFLVEHGWGTKETTHRGQQYRGGEHSADVVCAALSPLHAEVKRCERFALYPALDQARSDAGPGEFAYVAHRPNNKRWCIVMDAEDFLKLADLMGFGQEK